jgi:hypothetical protein
MGAVSEMLGLTLSWAAQLDGSLQRPVHDFKRLLETELIA